MPNPTPRGKMTDLQIAQEWAQRTRGQFFFSLPNDSKRVEWYTLSSDRKTPRYLHTAEVDAAILDFCLWLVQDGASLRISPTKVTSVRKLAVMLRVQTRHKSTPMNGGEAHA